VLLADSIEVIMAKAKKAEAPAAADAGKQSQLYCQDHYFLPNIIFSSCNKGLQSQKIVLLLLLS